MTYASDPLLDVRNLSISVPGRDGPVTIVEDVSFSIGRTEALGIVGESGCGKSISMLAITGLLGRGAQVTGGEAWFAGIDLLATNAKTLNDLRGDRIAFVFQDAMTAFNPVMRVGTQIMEALIHKKGLTRAEARDRASALFAQVGIPGGGVRLDDYPHQLSGGMRQRAMIAMALATEPDLLIADEPTTALDVTIQAQIVDLVKDIACQRDMALIWITHDLALVSGIVDAVSVFYAGRVVEHAQVDALYAAPSHPYTQGLLASLPTLNSIPGDHLSSIPGAPPDPRRMPSGCPFAPRCSIAVARCGDSRPRLRSLVGEVEHEVACIRADKLLKQVPA